MKGEKSVIHTVSFKVDDELFKRIGVVAAYSDHNTKTDFIKETLVTKIAKLKEEPEFQEFIKSFLN